MKKTLSLILAVLMLMSISSAAFAAGESTASVYVSVANKGKLEVAAKLITVKDIDGDKILTINDALYCAHEEYYDGGAEKGYGSYVGQYGLSLGKLWGEESNPDKNYFINFGYYVNDKSAWSLADVVTTGDFVYAFVYSDNTNWSDSYSFFDKKNVETDTVTETVFTLTSYSYDAEWNLVPSPVEGAMITVDGKDTGVKTDIDGKAVITVNTPGEHTVSATAPEGTILVPPVCKLNAKLDILKVIANFFNSIVDFIKGIFGNIFK